MSGSVEPGDDVVEVKRVEGVDAVAINKVDLPDIPLDMAKAQLGSAFTKTLKRSNAAPKEFGDKGRISRVCDGEDIPDWLARAWSRPEVRRQLVVSLAEDSGFFEVRMQMFERKGA